jgi:autophagy-related protein 9
MQVRQHTFQAVEASEAGSSAMGQSAQICHRLLSRNIHPGNGVIYNSPLGLLDADQRACPYILDWYYTCQLRQSDREDDASAHPEEASPGLGADIWPPWSKPLADIEEEQPWDSNLYERARSHLETSTSSAFFQGTTFKRQVKEQQYMSRQWWAQSLARPTDLLDSFSDPAEVSFLEPTNFRNPYESGHYSSHHSDWPMTSARPCGPQGSFLEPPIFGNHYTPDQCSSHHSEDLSSDGSGELDQSNTRSNNKSWRSPHALSKTLHTDDDFDMEQGLSFNFTDAPQTDDNKEQDQGNSHSAANMYGSTPASLTVRIIPRSSDPI